jgi:hypothetical protein
VRALTSFQALPRELSPAPWPTAFRAIRASSIARVRQNRLAGLTALVLLWALVLVMALVAERGIARQHLPWKPLSIVDPVGMATRIKAARAGADPATCRAILRKAGLSYEEVPEKTDGGFCTVRDAVP